MRAPALALAFALLACPAQAQEGYLRLEGHGGPVRGASVSDDGAYALTASFDYTLGLWDLQSGEALQWLDAHRAAANAALFLPDDKALSAGDDFDLILWDLTSGEALRRLQGHKGKLLSLALSPDGAMAASAGWDGAIGLWALPSGENLGFLQGHDSNVNDVAFAQERAELFSASYDGDIRRWDVEAQTLIRIEHRHGFGINSLVLNNAQGWLVFGAVDGAIKALDMQSGALIADFTTDRKPILAMALSPDGRLLAIGDGQGYIMVIDTQNWRILRDFKAAARGPVWALAFADNERLLAGGIEDEAALWPVLQGKAPLFADKGAPRGFLRDPQSMAPGERQFMRKCSICHTLTPDDARRAGPSLYRIFGRKAGSLPDYSYSDALLDSDIIWNDQTIDQLFDLGPDHVTPGSKMPMQRIAAPKDRAALIAYLKRAAGEAK